MPVDIRVLIKDSPSVSFDQALVTIGRDPDACDVVFAPSDNVVGRIHCHIESYSDGYILKVVANHYVSIDGKEAFDGDIVPPSAILQLGMGGPRLQVKYEPHWNLPATIGPRRGSGATAQAAMRSSRSAVVLLIATGVALLAVGFLSWRSIARMSRENKVSSSRIEQLGKSTRSLMEHEPVDWATIFAKSIPSVYAVGIRDEAGGKQFIATAWVLDRNQGVLATNAHVAEAFRDLSQGKQLFIQQSNSSQEVLVSRIDMHPGYKKFDELWLNYEPVLLNDETSMRQVDAAGPACDVGLLYVPMGLDLGPNLTIAPISELQGMRPGTQLGCIGFPLEGALLDGANLHAPVPATRIGYVSSLTDYFGRQEDPEACLLLQHTMPTTGGNSGSPIFNRAGQVVAVHNAGNVLGLVEGYRVGSSAGMFYAQRADLIHELIDGSAQKSQDRRTEIWRDRLSKEYLPKHNAEMEIVFKGLTKSWLASLKEMDLAMSLESMPETIKLGEIGLGEAEAFLFDAEPAVAYRILAYSPDHDSELQIEVQVDSKETFYVDGSWYVAHPWTSAKQEKIAMRVVGQSTSTRVNFRIEAVRPSEIDSEELIVRRVARLNALYDPPSIELSRKSAAEFVTDEYGNYEVDLKAPLNLYAIASTNLPGRLRMVLSEEREGQTTELQSDDRLKSEAFLPIFVSDGEYRLKVSSEPGTTFRLEYWENSKE